MYSLLVFTLVFVGGFSVMSIELLGGRILAPYFGSSIYVWGSIITVFMLALSLGYLAGGVLSLRNPSLKRLGTIFFVCAAAVLPLLFGGDVFMDWVFEHVADPRYGSLLASLALFFVPTVMMGFISPYAVRLLVESTQASGHVAGKLYFVSTAGSALGTLLTSFYLVLWFEVNQILTVLTAALALCGAVAWAVPPRSPAVRP
ncbi:MAG TPA: fused MFS/spermidine synthase [Gammaproteobacteria bacterium]|nr:fused MFS/spermidine synthase [Gammaproteobacteria bacterium]